MKHLESSAPQLRSGIQTSESKILAIRDWPKPKDKHELRSFLGLCTYYRRFVEGYADIAAPLHRLTEAKSTFHWSQDCENAFVTLKGGLCSSPVLVYPQPGMRFVLDTDASNSGIGAVLSQVQDGEERVIEYYSKILTKPERNYCATRRELSGNCGLALRRYLRRRPSLQRRIPEIRKSLESEVIALQEEPSTAERARRSAEVERDDLAEEANSKASRVTMLQDDKRRLENAGSLLEGQAKAEGLAERAHRAQSSVDLLTTEVAAERASCGKLENAGSLLEGQAKAEGLAERAHRAQSSVDLLTTEVAAERATCQKLENAGSLLERKNGPKCCRG
ncbi:K02A2.6-like [Cordylochernes scorpioides]|uniref:K02A2.6-like n=1 Tax=Cordylochernes scorpioides TaxID=51811 RepID=A0ABY6K0F6_9ARAC|nr:K02A2.6-like [Cordylochernes scorpioides]